MLTIFVGYCNRILCSTHNFIAICFFYIVISFSSFEISKNMETNFPCLYSSVHFFLSSFVNLLQQYILYPLHAFFGWCSYRLWICRLLILFYYVIFVCKNIMFWNNMKKLLAGLKIFMLILFLCFVYLLIRTCLVLMHANVSCWPMAPQNSRW